MPRKRSDEFYRKHGFTANYQRGKYTATCHFCDRELQNTALSRLKLHREICSQRRKQGTAAYTITRKKDIENRHNFKIKEYSGQDDTEGKEIIVKIEGIFDSADMDESADKTRAPVLVKSETRKSAYPDQEPEHHMEFEIASVDFIDESKEQQEEEFATLMEARPRNHLLALKVEKMRAEIKQYQSKTQFLRTETENLKAERTLTLLRIQKLRLEIGALRA